MNVKFFVTPVYPYGNDHYFHEIIAVAEGFRELGHYIFGNCNYWWEPETETYLIKEDLQNENYDIAIYDYRYVTSFAHLLFREGYPNFKKNKRHILIDRNDWISPIWWRNKHYAIFDLICAGNLYQDEVYPDNIKPWAIGLTNRIIQQIDKYYNLDIEREKVVAYNFRVDHNMRGVILSDLQNSLHTYPAVERITKGNLDNPNDLHYYKASTRRHDPDYFNLLTRTSFFMAYGGLYEFKPRIYQPYSLIDKIRRKPAFWRYKKRKATKQDFSDLVFIFQQDSFRFFEVLYSGSIAIHIDLNHWKFLMPAMPISEREYIGIKDLKDNGLEETIKSLSSEKIAQISITGREWVYKHYSPKAQAERILTYLESL